MVYVGVTKEEIDEIFGRVKKKDDKWPNEPPKVEQQIYDIANYECSYCRKNHFLENN